MPIIPEARQALMGLFLAINKFYVDHPGVPMDAPIVKLLGTMHAIARDDDADWQAALRRSVDIIEPLVISADSGIAEALREARRSLISLKHTQRLVAAPAR